MKAERINLESTAAADGGPADAGEQLRQWIEANPAEVKRIAARARRHNIAYFDKKADRELAADREAERQAAALAGVISTR